MRFGARVYHASERWKQHHVRPEHARRTPQAMGRGSSALLKIDGGRGSQALLESQARRLVAEPLVERVRLDALPVARELEERATARRDPALRRGDERATDASPARALRDDQGRDATHGRRAMQDRSDVHGREPNEIAVAL